MREHGNTEYKMIKYNIDNTVVITSVSDCCLMPTQQFFSYIMVEQINFQWNDEVRFVLDQHAKLDFFYSTSSLKQQSSDKHLDTLFWFRPKQSLPFLLNAECLAEKQQIPIL
jgi:hypothetical protein